MTDLAQVDAHNAFVADETSKILLKLYKENRDITPAVLAAVGCGMLFNAIKNHPDFEDAPEAQITREMHRLVDRFLETFTPNMLN